MKSYSVSIIIDSLIKHINFQSEDFSKNLLSTDINNASSNILKLVEDPNTRKVFANFSPLFQFKDSIALISKVFSISKPSMNLFLQILISKLLISELDIKNYLLSRTMATTCIFGPTLSARVLTNRNIINQGDMYQSDIFIASHFISSSPIAFIGKLDSIALRDKKEFGGFLPLRKKPVIQGTEIEVENGLGKFQQLNNTIGIHKYSGALEVTGEDGNPEYYPFEAEYEVIPKTPK